MRFLGIDYGHKKVGFALSDESGVMAFPYGVVENDKHLLTTIVKLIEKENIKEIVIGHSINKDGTDNKIHEAVTEFITTLTLETGLPIHLEPEQYTTQEALRIQGRNEQTDAAAATIILNSFLQKQS